MALASFEEPAALRRTGFTRHMAAGAMLALLGSAVCASASTVTKYVTFSGSNFQSYDASNQTTSAPAVGNPSVTGAFTLSFDPSVLAENLTTGISLNSLSLSLGSALSYSFDPATDKLDVGGIASNVSNADVFGTQVVNFDPATDDFYLQISNFLGTASVANLGFAQTSIPRTLFYADPALGANVSVTVGNVTTSPVPLPPALPLVASGFGLAGFVARRRTRSGRPA